MESPLPPDPYAALGVASTCDAAVIKSTYRKLVLRCHPDKFPDPAVKAQKGEEFHKIQQAYEIIGDEEKRSMYDAQIRLAELRREMLERKGSGKPKVEVRGDYEVRTAAPSFSTYPPSPAHGSPKSHSERKSSRVHEEYDRYYEESRSYSRKDGGHDAHTKRSTKERQSTRTARESDRSRSERKRDQARAEKRDRRAKYSYVEEEDDSDNRDRDQARYEAEVRRRNEEERARQDRESYAMAAEEARRKTEEGRRKAEAILKKDREFYDERERKLHSNINGARDYIASLRESDARPQPTRTDSSKHYYEVRHTAERPVEVRRSSAARIKPSRTSSGRDGRDSRRRGSYPEIVEFATETRRPATLRASESSPAEIKIPRAQTFHGDFERIEESAQPPMIRRAETMPTSHGSSRKKDHASHGSSKLRQSESIVPNDSGYESPSSPESQLNQSQQLPSRSAASSHYVYKSAPGGGVNLAPEDHTYRTVLRSPEQQFRRKSQSPVGPTDRPSSTRYTYTYPEPVSKKTSARVPPLARSTTTAVAHSPERVASGGRRQLFGEVVDGVSYSKRHDFSDIQWASPGAAERRGRARDRDFGMDFERGRPMLRRGETAY